MREQSLSKQAGNASLLAWIEISFQEGQSVYCHQAVTEGAWIFFHYLFYILFYFLFFSIVLPFSYTCEINHEINLVRPCGSMITIHMIMNFYFFIDPNNSYDAYIYNHISRFFAIILFDQFQS